MGRRPPKVNGSANSPASRRLGKPKPAPRNRMIFVLAPMQRFIESARRTHLHQRKDDAVDGCNAQILLKNSEIDPTLKSRIRARHLVSADRALSRRWQLAGALNAA